MSIDPSVAEDILPFPGDEVEPDEDVYDRELAPQEQDIDQFEIDVKEERFSIHELTRRIRAKRLVLDPEFQRHFVWKRWQCSQFIESILLNIPLPPLFINQTAKGEYIIIDGRQRTTTMYTFINNEFQLEGLEALSWLNGKCFGDLGEKIRARIEDRQLNCFVLKPSVPMSVVYDIFHRINTGGTALNRQEIRHGIYQGEATRLLARAATYVDFTSTAPMGRRAIRMKDREVVLRCLAFRLLGFEDYRGDMDEFLNEAMRRLNFASTADVGMLEQGFYRSMTWCRRVFGDNVFRIPTEYTRGQINIALVETISYFMWSHSDDLIEHNLAKIAANYELLLGDEEYLDACRRATGSVGHVLRRFQRVENWLAQGVEV